MLGRGRDVLVIARQGAAELGGSGIESELERVVSQRSLRRGL